MSTAPVKHYQYPISQPCRTVSWLIRLGNIPHEDVLIHPFKGEHKTPEFLKKHPAGMIPLIETPCSVCAPESGAIMIYLCNTYGFTEYYPVDEVQRLKINSAMFAHGTTVRKVTTNAMYPCVMVMREKGDNATMADYKQAIESKLPDLKQALTQIDGFLAGRKYIADTEKPTIADLLATSELNQLPLMCGMLPSEITEFTDYPNIKNYCELMAQVPHHDEYQAPFKQFLQMMTKA